MTTTIVADLENIAAVKHVGHLTFRSGVALRSDGTTKIVTEYLHTVKPVNGVVTVELVPGPAVLQFGGTDYPFTVPADPGTNVPLWPLIEAYIEVPPDTPTQRIDAAVERYIAENPIEAGLTEQEADTRYAPIGSAGATTVDALTDATTVGKAVAKAPNATAARSAIAAGSRIGVYASDYDTIQEAIDATPVGGHCVVGPGLYRVPSLLITKTMTMRVERGATIKSADAGVANGPVITVDAPGVTITGGGVLDGNRDNLGTNTPGRNWQCVYGTRLATDLLVQGITAQKSVAAGIWSEGTATKVYDVTARATGRQGILLSSYPISAIVIDTFDMDVQRCVVDMSMEDPAASSSACVQIRGGDSDGVKRTYRGRVTDCTLKMPMNPSDPEGYTTGIEFARGEYSLAQGNTVIGGGLGISFAGNAHSQCIGNLLIGQNVIAIEVAGSPSTIVQGNTVDGGGILGGNGNGAIATTGPQTSVQMICVGNTVFNLADAGNGITMDAVRCIAEANVIEAVNGIVVSRNGCLVASNQMLGKSYSSSCGILLANASFVSVTGNQIRGYEKGIDVQIPSGQVVDNVAVTLNLLRQTTTVFTRSGPGADTPGTLGLNVINEKNRWSAT